MMTGKKLAMALLALALLAVPGLVACGDSEPTATPFALPASGSLGDTWTRPADGMVMVYVPGGTFQMGSMEGLDDEQPVHTVTLDSFWIDRTEVTNAQYKQCVEAGVCQAPATCDWGEPTYQDTSKADHPVVCVDWYSAQAYCEWAGGRLPTEAEWEYATRGPDGYTYPWGDTFDGERLNLCDVNCTYVHRNTDYDDGYEQTAPVGSFEDGASWCGALDMAGNVWEWTLSLYESYPYQADDGREDPGSTAPRVLRGGSWAFQSNYVRSAIRSWGRPRIRYAHWGLRCGVVPTSSSVRTVDPKHAVDVDDG